MHPEEGPQSNRPAPREEDNVGGRTQMSVSPPAAGNHAHKQRRRRRKRRQQATSDSDAVPPLAASSTSATPPPRDRTAMLTPRGSAPLPMSSPMLSPLASAPVPLTSPVGSAQLPPSFSRAGSGNISWLEGQPEVVVRIKGRKRHAFTWALVGALLTLAAMLMASQVCIPHNGAADFGAVCKNSGRASTSWWPWFPLQNGIVGMNQRTVHLPGGLDVRVPVPKFELQVGLNEAPRCVPAMLA